MLERLPARLGQALRGVRAHESEDADSPTCLPLVQAIVGAMAGTDGRLAAGALPHSGQSFPWAPRWAATRISRWAICRRTRPRVTERTGMPSRCSHSSRARGSKHRSRLLALWL
jgi:hypothetical protein